MFQSKLICIVIPKVSEFDLKIWTSSCTLLLGEVASMRFYLVLHFISIIRLNAVFAASWYCAGSGAN
jgi:hypothetical protein